MQNEGYVPVTGGNVWYRIIGTRDKSPLLVLHGGPGYAHHYLRPLDGLADTLPVVFYDQLGCGNSDWPADERLWTIKRFRDELRQIQETLGIEKMHLFGHSWGSILAVEYYLAYPDFVKSIVLASPCLNTARWTEDAAELIELLPEATRKSIYSHQADGTTQSEEYILAVREYERRYLCRLEPPPQPMLESKANTNDLIYTTMWGPSEFFPTGTLKDYDCTGRLHKVSCPVLFTCGRYDEATPSATQWYSSLVPNSKIAIFEQSAHMAHLEETGAYLGAVGNFLKHIEPL